MCVINLWKTYKIYVSCVIVNWILLHSLKLLLIRLVFWSDNKKVTRLGSQIDNTKVIIRNRRHNLKL